MVDFDKLNNIDDWEALGINYNPTSHKDWTIQDLLIARDKLNDLINAIPDSQKYSIFNKDAANSDHVRLLLLRSAFENALSNHKQNTALWAKDPHLNEYTSKAEDYDGNTYKDHFGEEQAADAIDFKAGSPGHLAYIEKQHPGTIDKWLTNKLKEAKHFGEEQTSDLKNLADAIQGVM